MTWCRCPVPRLRDAPVTFDTIAYTTSSNGQGLVISASGGGSGLDMGTSGVGVMLHVTIPTNAVLGQSYFLNVLISFGHFRRAAGHGRLRHAGRANFDHYGPDLHGRRFFSQLRLQRGTIWQWRFGQC